MNAKRCLHVMTCPLTRRNVLAALVGAAAKSSVLFHAPQEEHAVRMLGLRPVAAAELTEEQFQLEQAILAKIKKFQPMDWLGADGRSRAQVVPTWALY